MHTFDIVYTAKFTPWKMFIFSERFRVKENSDLYKRFNEKRVYPAHLTITTPPYLHFLRGDAFMQKK